MWLEQFNKTEIKNLKSQFKKKHFDSYIHIILEKVKEVSGNKYNVFTDEAYYVTAANLMADKFRKNPELLTNQDDFEVNVEKNCVFIEYILSQLISRFPDANFSPK